jgi:hypothetical protein
MATVWVDNLNTIVNLGGPAEYAATTESKLAQASRASLLGNSVGLSLVACWPSPPMVASLLQKVAS